MKEEELIFDNTRKDTKWLICCGDQATHQVHNSAKFITFVRKKF